MAPDDKVIVFVGKKVRVEALSCNIGLSKIRFQSIHGNLEQYDREQALEDFKTGVVHILIATDVASRGIDIEDVT
jgi:ATP-dependent RNA helicase DDX43